MTLVFCGSLGSTAAMWEPQRELAPDLMFELPGHGAAPLLDNVTIDALAERVLAQVDGPFSLVGLSLGGTIAMRVAAIAPERVEALVLACTATTFGDPAQWRDRAQTVRNEGLLAIVDAVLARWFTPHYGDVTRWREMFLSIDPRGYASCCEALAGWNGSADLARIEAPTLVIAGSEDPTAPPPEAYAIAALVRDARVSVIDDAAHLANVEQPEIFNRLVRGQL